MVEQEWINKSILEHPDRTNLIVGKTHIFPHQEKYGRGITFKEKGIDSELWKFLSYGENESDT